METVSTKEILVTLKIQLQLFFVLREKFAETLNVIKAADPLASTTKIVSM